MSTKSYSSKTKTIESIKLQNWNQKTYATYIHDFLGEIEFNFFKEINDVFEELSALDIETYTVDNTLGIEEVQLEAVAGVTAVATTTKQVTVKKDQINIVDVLVKTDIIGLKSQLEEYVKEKSSEGYSGYHIQELKKDFYEDQVVTLFDHDKYANGVLEGFSTVLNYIPIIGGVKNIVEANIGYTLDGEKLSADEKSMLITMGGLTIVIDVVTLGIGSIGKTGVKAVVEVFIKDAVVSVAIGWTSEYASEKLREMGLTPEEIFLVHLAVMVVATAASVGVKESENLDDLVKQTGLTTDQLDDIMKHTGLNADELADALKKGDLLDIIQGRNIDFSKVSTNGYDNAVSSGLKPSNSPTLDTWTKKGGTIEVNADGSIWKYTDIDGNVVYYRDGFPDFYPYKHPEVNPVTIEVTKPKNNDADFKAANEAAGLGANSTPPVDDMSKPPDGYTWHHMEDGKTMILVESDIHKQFTHIGGQSIVNGKGSK